MFGVFSALFYGHQLWHVTNLQFGVGAFAERLDAGQFIRQEVAIDFRAVNFGLAVGSAAFCVGHTVLRYGVSGRCAISFCWNRQSVSVHSVATHHL